MKNKYSDDRFLARWLSGTLNDQEQTTFEQSEDFQKYQRILETLDRLKPPTYDKQNLFDKIEENIDQKPKVVKLLPNWVYGIAASFLLLIGGVFYFSNSFTKHSAGFGEQIAYTLPDDSEVMLNARSEIKYKKSSWEDHREIHLSGEAFFKVKKGSKFNVITSLGSVEVLGTQFNVNTRENIFEIVCIEGKVKIITKDKISVILTKGKALRSINTQIEQWDINFQKPGWMLGESSFTSTPIRQVILSLENQFNITFEKKNIDENERFTGSFSHANKELALKTIFVPMEISYTFAGKNTVVIYKE